MKEKRKNLDKIDLQAISRSSKEAGEAAYRQRVQDLADKIRKRLGDGKFKTTPEGNLIVSFWIANQGYNFNNDVTKNLKADFDDVDYDADGFGIKWKLKP